MKDKEFYRAEIIKMIEKMESCESLYKIFSFVRVFYSRDNHKIDRRAIK
jgi:hypothetical protein